MKRILVITLALILLCSPALAEINLIEFTELCITRILSIYPDAEFYNFGNGIWFDMIETSAGFVRIDDKFNVDEVWFRYTYSDKSDESTQKFLMLIAAISALEYDGITGKILELTGETPMQAAYSLYVNNFEPKIKANYSSVKNGEPIEIYSSKEFRYMLHGGKDVDGKPTGTSGLCAERINKDPAGATPGAAQ